MTLRTRELKVLVDHVRELTNRGDVSKELSDSLLDLRDATANYLNKEWKRVKTESTKGKS